MTKSKTKRTAIAVHPGQLSLWDIPGFLPEAAPKPVAIESMPEVMPEAEPESIAADVLALVESEQPDQGKAEEQPAGMTIHQLAKAIPGVTTRQITHFHRLGLMPNTALVGNRRLYGPEEVNRLRQIVKLRKKGIKAEQIRQRLG